MSIPNSILLSGKQVLVVGLLLTLLGNSSFFVPTAIAASTKGQQIVFAVKDGKFTYLKINGKNQNGEIKTWEWRPAYAATIALTENYYWTEGVILEFDVVGLGRRVCIIEYLKTVVGSKQAAIVYTKGQGCSGEGGGAQSNRTILEKLFYDMPEEDSYKVVDALGSLSDQFGCLEQIFTGLGSKAAVIKLTINCGQVVLDSLNEVLRAYKKEAILEQAAVDDVKFVVDVTFPDGTLWPANKPLNKIWRLQNSGQTTWTTDYQLTFVRGDRMNGAAGVLPKRVAPGETVEIAVEMQASAIAGTYQGYWRLKNAQGQAFGEEIWVRIQVATQAPPATATPQPPAPANDATKEIAIVKIEYPSTVVPGERFRPKVTIKVNQGQLLQSKGDMLKNVDGNLYGAHPHVAVTGNVTAGQTYTFEFYENNPIAAPDQDGVYESKWRIWRNGVWVGPEIIIHFTVQRPSLPTAVPPLADIFFRADRTVINQGECVTLQWDVEHVKEVYLEKEGVAGHGNRQVCPDATKTYHLVVVLQDGNKENHTVTIQVGASGHVDTPAGVICGQFMRINQSIDKWPAFQPYGTNEVWIIDPFEFDYLSDIFQEGAYVQIEEPEFGDDSAPAWGYTRVRYLIDDNGTELVSGCATTGSQSPPLSNDQPIDLAQFRQTLLVRLGSASVSTDYPQPAQQFVAALFAHVEALPAGSSGITQETMIQALNREDAAVRINALVQGVWDAWLTTAQQGGFDPYATDPNDLSPFRQLVIRMIQGRQGGLNDAQRHALYNFFTRTEDVQAWRDNINGVIGAVNRESFQWQ